MKAKFGDNVVFQNLERVSGPVIPFRVGSKTILLVLITLISALATMFIWDRFKS